MGIRHHRSPSRRHGRTALGLVGSVALAGAMTLLAPAPSASAAGLIPSGVTVTVSPATSSLGSAVHVTATVKILGVLPGLGITPKGTVTFKAISPSVHSLGQAALGSCFLTSCTASVDTTALPAGNIVIVQATYSGDTLLAGSSGTGKAKVTFSTSDFETCPDVCGASVSTPDGANSANLAIDDSTESHDLYLSFDTSVDQPCAANEAPTGSAMVSWYVAPDDVGQTVDYTLTGAQAQNVKSHDTSHPKWLVCFQEQAPFQGYVNGQLVQAPFVSVGEGGYYQAFLQNCSDTDGVRPCFTFHDNLNDVEFPNVDVTISAPVGDPKGWVG